MVKYTASPGIYIILNTKNGKIYIGQAEDIHVRQIEHKRELNKNTHHNAHLQRAWNKYGEKVFQFKILEYCPIGDLDEREQHYLDVYIPKGICYNIALDATAPMRGIKHTEQSLEKMRKFQRETPRTFSPKQREHLATLIESNKGRKHDPEFGKRISERQTGDKNPMFGKPHSEEHKRKISEAGKGRIATEETRRKLSDSNKGKIRSEETRKKISEAALKRPPVSEETRRKLSEIGKGKTRSEETKKRMSEAAKLRWAKQKEKD